MMIPGVKGTPFHSRTSAACESQMWRRWAGFLAASSYELSHEREYYAIRTAAALIDVSPLFKYLIRGADAVRLLDRVVTRDVSRCVVGRVMYTPWCDEAGKVIDDGTLSRLDDRAFRLTAADPSLLWLEDNAVGLGDVRIEDVSEATAALAIQGPRSREILEQATKASLARLKYFRLTSARVGGIPATISRTGYTGDLGYEIWVDADRAEGLWDALVECGRGYGLLPAGMLALDIARLEAGLLLIEVDYISAERAVIEAQKSSPLELGLGWAVDFEKRAFVGREALMEERRRGPAWQFVRLEVEWDSLEAEFAAVGLPVQLPSAAWRASVPIYAGGQQAGYATSGCWSPILKKYIALAHLQTPFARPGTPLAIEVTVEHRRRQAACRVVPTPFFDPERKRKP